MRGSAAGIAIASDRGPFTLSLPRSRVLPGRFRGCRSESCATTSRSAWRDRACRARGGCAFDRVRILPFPVAFRFTGACIVTTCDRVEGDRNRIPLARNDTCPSRVALGSNEAAIRSLASAFAVTASASSTTTSARQRTASRFAAPIAAHATQELARLSPPSALRPPATGRERPHRHQRDQCRRRARPTSGRASGRDV
jgi:hypothetical protein